MKILIIANDTNTSDGWGRYTVDFKKGLQSKGLNVCTADEITNIKLSKPLNYLRPFNLFNFIRDLLNIKKAINTFQPDVVHFTIEPYSILIPFLKIRQKTILTLHGTYSYIPNLVNFLIRPIYVKWVKKVFPSFNSLVAVSEYTKKYLINEATKDKIYLDSSFINVIHNGINLDWTKFDLDKKEKDKKVILTVGAVKKRKGIFETINGISNYKERYNESFIYKIVGKYNKSDSYFQDIVDFINKNNLKENIIFTGKIDQEELEKEYQEADVFVLTPIKEGPYFEGFGLVYLEANAFGIPVIGSKDTGSAEAIEDKVNGYVVNSNNPGEISEKLNLILKNDLIKRSDCREWAEKHNIDKQVERYIHLYEK